MVRQAHHEDSALDLILSLSKDDNQSPPIGYCHCERSEAIQRRKMLPWIATGLSALAMTLRTVCQTMRGRIWDVR